MRHLVFAALSFIVLFWGSTTGTLPEERPTTREIAAAWSVPEAMAAPDPSISVW